jgi:hypothetical protein
VEFLYLGLVPCTPQLHLFDYPIFTDPDIPFTLFHLRPSNTKSWFLLYVISIVCSSDLLCMCHFSRLMMSLLSRRSATSPQQYAIISTASMPAFSIDNRNQWIAHHHRLVPLQSIQRILCLPGLPPTIRTNTIHGCHHCMARSLGLLIDLLNSTLCQCVTSLRKVRSDIRLRQAVFSRLQCMHAHSAPSTRPFFVFCATFNDCFNDLTHLCHFNVIVLVLILSLQAPGTGGFASSGEPSLLGL